MSPELPIYFMPSLFSFKGFHNCLVYSHFLLFQSFRLDFCFEYMQVRVEGDFPERAGPGLLIGCRARHVIVRFDL
jgi:hypothetical protein